MNYKCKLHAKVIVSPKEFPDQVFSIEMMLDSKLQFPPGFIESKKEKVSSLSLDFDSVLKASLENMYPDFNIDFEIYHSEVTEDKTLSYTQPNLWVPEGNAIDDDANGNDL